LLQLVELVAVALELLAALADGHGLPLSLLARTLQLVGHVAPFALHVLLQALAFAAFVLEPAAARLSQLCFQGGAGLIGYAARLALGLGQPSLRPLLRVGLRLGVAVAF